MSKVNEVGHVVVVNGRVIVEEIRVVVRVVHMVVSVEEPVEVVIWVVMEGCVVVVPMGPVVGGEIILTLFVESF